MRDRYVVDDEQASPGDTSATNGNPIVAKENGVVNKSIQTATTEDQLVAMDSNNYVDDKYTTDEIKAVTNCNRCDDVVGPRDSSPDNPDVSHNAPFSRTSRLRQPLDRRGRTQKVGPEKHNQPGRSRV
jgi:hypothetical protein